MAAPLSTGAAALLRSVDRHLSPDRLVKRLRDRGKKLCGSSLKQLDIAAALLDERESDKPDCDPPRN